MLKNKNILFSTDNIVGYKESVENALKKRFLEVEYIEEYLPTKEKRSLGFKILREISKNFNDKNIIKKIYKNLERKNIKKILNKYKFKFDYFLVVAGREFSKEFLEILKEYNPEIKCILFLWDAFEETSLRKSSSEFDYIFSFDQKDCEKYGFIFRPSFFSDLYLKNTDEKSIDFYYIGALRERKRYEIALNFYNYCKKNNLKCFIKIYVNKKNKYLLPDNYVEDIVTFDKIKYLKNIELTKKSKVILDINHSNQGGLTLRSIEGLASKSKIITTNKSIKNYDFYHRNNILIVDEIDKIDSIPLEFFKIKFKEVPESIASIYTAAGFIKDIFNEIISN